MKEYVDNKRKRESEFIQEKIDYIREKGYVAIILDENAKFFDKESEDVFRTLVIVEKTADDWLRTMCSKIKRRNFYEEQGDIDEVKHLIGVIGEQLDHIIVAIGKLTTLSCNTAKLVADIVDKGV